MPIDALSAANAYRNQMKMMQGAAGDAQDSASGAGPSFAQMVKDAAQGFADTEKQSEAHQMQSLTEGGKVDHLADVVTAMTNAELTLNTVVAIRDRVINAYNDIIKMTI